MLLLSLATIFTLVLLLGSGVWIAFALIGTAWIALQFFSPFDPGPILASDFWGASYGWDLTALPMFIWMGEILFRSGLADNMFRGLSPWLNRLPGRLLHTNIIGSGMFAAVCGSSAATCASTRPPTCQTARARPRRLSSRLTASSRTAACSVRVHACLPTRCSAPCLRYGAMIRCSPGLRWWGREPDKHGSLWALSVLACASRKGVRHDTCASR